MAINLGCCEHAAVAVPAPGIPGPPGLSGGEVFVHEQTTASAEWLISHPLGRNPYSVQLEQGIDVVIPDVSFPSVGTVLLTFPYPQTGTVTLL
ncbi:hypothetical protein [Hoyosella altamirensis]|uniref:Uncharacterized protein n=1 Tax=Hoyosella altamirensis TaxID=616997 RepID=A0A839RUB9_9ACTN|nr:hypothetical protein [Hoyosella altamirensis]MBB3039808.1 hypothetical protein [Hoyosella altamirensis]